MKKRSAWRVTIVVLLLVAVCAVFIVAIATLPQLPPELSDMSQISPTRIYAEDGQLIKVLASREIVPIEEMSPYIVNAILSLEDPGFYSHHGFSKKAFLRAMWKNLKSFRVREGGSTITQQLAKNLFFTFRRSYLRKIQEALVTFQLERQFSKRDILEAYLNQIDFGAPIYGVERAAQAYFAKHADELNLAESALLAGIPRWPARYNPYKNPEIALERLVFVLKRMQDEGCITAEERAEALEFELDFHRMDQLHGRADYFIDYILNTTGEKYGRKAVNYGGLEIYSTLNRKYQFAATSAVTDGLKRLDDLLGLKPYDEADWEEKLDYPQAALVALDPQTGAVRAMVGGRDFQRAPFGRAVSSNRLPGSSFKVFTYFAALDKGIIEPTTVLVDEPVEFEIYDQVWTPKNFEDEYIGPVVAKQALMLSINTIAAKLMDKVKPAAVIEIAHKFGITSELEENYSLALGTSGVSPLEMATAYATIAGLGIAREPYMLKKIVTPENDMLEEWELKSRRVADPQTCYLLVDFMTGVIENGTGKSVKNYGFYRTCAGKTGTTNDHRDAWFVGFSPDLVAAVWVGYDDNRTMKNKWGSGITGATGALPIWAWFMKRALEGTVDRPFPFPPGLEFKVVDPRTGGGPMPGGPRLPVAVRVK
ncbi:PBP1A family penicillin-binding protein [candidate division KSB1 bacterium]|nr:PBP1A family penicillin-binding protein [candidate division KSB1 bacterium]